MSDPNPKVNLAGSGVLGHVQRPDGEFIPQTGTNDGAANVSLVGAAGSGLATEATAEAQLARTPPLDTPEDGDASVPGVPVTARLQGFVPGNGWYNIQLYGGPLLGSELGLPVRIASSVPLLTQPTPAFAASAPHAGTDTPNGATFYLAGVDRENVGGEVPLWGPVVAAYQRGGWSVDQGAPAGVDKAWPTIKTYGSGRAIYRVGIAAITLAGTNKSLLALQNAGDASVRIISVAIQNAQFTNITGAVQIFNTRRTLGTMSGGSAASVLVGRSNPAYAPLDVGISWVTGGTMGGSPEIIDFRRFSADDVAVAATDTSVHQFVHQGLFDSFDFRDDPIVVPTGYCFDLQLQATVTAGQFDIHMLIEGVYP